MLGLRLSVFSEFGSLLILFLLFTFLGFISFFFLFFVLQLPFSFMLIVWCGLLFSFPHITSLTGVAAKVVYSLWVCSLFLCLSGVFVLAPAATQVLYGPTHMAVNYGLVYNSFVSMTFD